MPRSFRAARWALLALLLPLGACDPLDLLEMFADRPQGTSILTLLETDGREIELNEEVAGTLSSSDFESVDGSYLEAWAFEGRPGQDVSIDLISDDFDAYLYVVGPGLEEALRDDDSGGACHARIDFTVLERGTFYVVASTLSSNTSGTFRLRASDTPQPVAGVSCGGVDPARLMAMPSLGIVRMGDEVYGSLTGAEASVSDGRPVQAWTIRASAGDRVVVSLRSDDFDAYLYVAGPGLSEALSDDDGGADLNSELTVTFPQDGAYTIGAAALASGASGQYTLSIGAPVDLASLDTQGRNLRPSSERPGSLLATDPVVEGRPVQAWAFQAQAGQRAIIELISEDFDSYLQIAGPGLLAPLTDDDSAGDLDSRIELVFPESGTYRLIAGSLGGDTGSYVLRAR